MHMTVRPSAGPRHAVPLDEAVADFVDRSRFNRVCSQVDLIGVSLDLHVHTYFHQLVSQRIYRLLFQPSASVIHRHGRPSEAHYQGDGTTHG